MFRTPVAEPQPHTSCPVPARPSNGGCRQHDDAHECRAVADASQRLRKPLHILRTPDAAPRCGWQINDASSRRLEIGANMKKVLWATVSMIALASAAQAADLRPAYKAASPARTRNSLCRKRISAAPPVSTRPAAPSAELPATIGSTAVSSTV